MFTTKGVENTRPLFLLAQVLVNRQDGTFREAWTVAFSVAVSEENTC